MGLSYQEFIKSKQHTSINVFGLGEVAEPDA